MTGRSSTSTSDYLYRGQDHGSGKGGARLLGRSGHLGGDRLDRRADRRGRDRGRGRRRPGRRGPGDDPQAGAGLRRGRGRGGRRARGVRRDVLHRGPAGQRALHGQVPAGLGAVPAADRDPPGPGGRREGRHRGCPRLHRQGQRPGAFRGRAGRPGARAQGERAGPGLGHDPGQGDRVRRGQGAADRRDGPLALLDRPEPLGPLVRDRAPGRHLGSAARRRVGLHRRPVAAARAGRAGADVRRRGAGCHRRAAAHPAGDHHRAERAGRGAGHRPHRHGGGPARRDQEPGDLRGARGDHPDHRALRARERVRRAGPGPVQARGGAALDRADLRRPVVLPAQAGAGRLHRRGLGARIRGRADAAARRPRGGHRPAQRRLAVRLRPGHLRHGRHVRPVAVQGLHRPVGPAQQDRRHPRPPRVGA